MKREEEDGKRSVEAHDRLEIEVQVRKTMAKTMNRVLDEMEQRREVWRYEARQGCRTKIRLMMS